MGRTATTGWLIHRPSSTKRDILATAAGISTTLLSIILATGADFVFSVNLRRSTKNEASVNAPFFGKLRESRKLYIPSRFSFQLLSCDTYAAVNSDALRRFNGQTHYLCGTPVATLVSKTLEPI